MVAILDITSSDTGLSKTVQTGGHKLLEIP